MTRPSSVAASEPASGPHGKPIPASANRRDTTNPDTPASATWASDTWPTKPVITTSERHTTIPIRDSISAWR